MSIRAYKLQKVVSAETSTFNFNNLFIAKWLSNEIMDMGDGEFLSVEKSAIQEPLDDADVAKHYGFGDEEMDIVRQMLKDCGDANFVEYLCC